MLRTLYASIGAVLIAASPSLAAHADDILGVWFNSEKDARIEIAQCGEKYCGTVVWLNEPNYPEGSKDGIPGSPKTDHHNPDPSLRHTPIIGLQIVRDFSFAGENLWKDGKVYDPKNGMTYKVFDPVMSGDSVLLRADRAAYVVGETMSLAAFTPVGSGAIYLDIVKAGQTLSTRSAPVSAGKAEFAIDVSPDMVGTLELHAYKVLLDGTMVRDTRVAVVDAPNDLSITVLADRDTYLPGETATIDFKTGELGTGESGNQGAPVQTALGIAIVDESVFALQRQDPGFAKL